MRPTGVRPGPRRGSTALKVLLAVVGVVLSTILIGSTFFKLGRADGRFTLTPRFDLSTFFSDLPSQLKWLIPFILLSAAIIPLRALQWQATLPMRVAFRERYHLVGIGAFTHNVVPGKLGDLFRSFLMARTQNLPFMQALGSVLVCKLFEFAALMMLVAVGFLSPFRHVLGRFSSGLWIAIPACVGLVILVVVLAHWAGDLADWLDRRHRLPKLRGFLRNLGEGLGAARSVPGMGRVLLLSVGPVLASSLAYGVALTGLGVKGGLFAGPVVLGAIALGQLVPGLPVGTGVYYFVTSWTARELGVPAADAAAFSILTHMATVLTMTGVGAISVWRRKLSWKELRKRATEAAQTIRFEQQVRQP